MIVAGVMSGTSADGIDVALVEVDEKKTRSFGVRFELLSHDRTSYPKPVREAVLEAMNSDRAGVAELSRLNFLLGELYAEAVRKAQRNAKNLKLNLVGCHGQTIYHEGGSNTLQIGEPAVIAERTGVPVQGPA